MIFFKCHLKSVLLLKPDETRKEFYFFYSPIKFHVKLD